MKNYLVKKIYNSPKLKYSIIIIIIISKKE